MPLQQGYVDQQMTHLSLSLVGNEFASLVVSNHEQNVHCGGVFESKVKLDSDFVSMKV